jgi:hypothetical protein
MVPSANLIGFAGQELGRKLPHVFATILETTLGSVVEIILFMVLISRGNEQIPIIKAAILGSILANLLLCLGLCFFAGGMRRDEQEFHEAVSEVGSNLMLVAGSTYLWHDYVHISMLLIGYSSGSGRSGGLQLGAQCFIGTNQQDSTHQSSICHYSHDRLPYVRATRSHASVVVTNKMVTVSSFSSCGPIIVSTRLPFMEMTTRMLIGTRT